MPPKKRYAPDRPLHIQVFCGGLSLERARPLLDKLKEYNLWVDVRTEKDLEKDLEHLSPKAERQISESLVSGTDIETSVRTRKSTTDFGSITGEPLDPKTLKAGAKNGKKMPGKGVPDVVMVLWSFYFQGAIKDRLAQVVQEARDAGAVVLSDVQRLWDMQDRVWLLQMMEEHNVPVPAYVACSREGGNEPVLEESDDHIVVNGQRIKKPFVEKPIDRRDRDIYIYFPKAAGGGRSLASTRFSGDIEYVFRFDPVSRVRRAGSYVYQEYLQSEGFMVQAICVGTHSFGNAVLSGVVHKSGHRGGASKASMDHVYQPCAVRLRQEEKLIASKLHTVFGQTLFGITFARSQSPDGQLDSRVIDVWPAIPSSGLGSHCDDVVKALLETVSPRLPPKLGRSLQDGMLMASATTPTGEDSSVSDRTHRGSDEEDPIRDECICVLLVARHSERTPKQKVKAKIKLDSEFAAGWLCGWLAGADAEVPTAVRPPSTYELRTKEQLARLGGTCLKLMNDGHKIDMLNDALVRIDKEESLDCHAKIEADASTLKVALKWGGELTKSGVKDSEAFGRAFREEVYPGEEVDELHATFRHDIKVYASQEPRCQQTAAAFCQGLLHLSSELPQVITALVRTDKFDVEKTASADDTASSPWPSLETPWEQVEALAGTSCVGAALKAFGAPGPALEALAEAVGRLCAALSGEEEWGTLYLNETPSLLRLRYKDASEDFGEPGQRNFAKVSNLLDLFMYEWRHNRDALPEAVRSELDAALPLCEALCDVAVPLQARHKQQIDGGDNAGLSLLHKLRWDLLVASGIDLGDKLAYEKHAAIYPEKITRTRLYFNHNSRLQALLAILLAAPAAAAGGAREEGNGRAAATPPRLDFLSHLVVRLWRMASDGSLEVAAEFAKSDTEARGQIFRLPLAEVDKWWSRELARRPVRENPGGCGDGGYPAEAPSSPGSPS